MFRECFSYYSCEIIWIHSDRGFVPENDVLFPDQEFGLPVPTAKGLNLGQSGILAPLKQQRSLFAMAGISMIFRGSLHVDNTLQARRIQNFLENFDGSQQVQRCT